MTDLLKIVPANTFKSPLFSKWQKIQVLLDPIEMENLLQDLSPFVILNISQVVPFENLSFSLDAFLKMYKKYIDMLRGKIPKQKISIAYGLSQQIDNFRAIAVAPCKYICRALQPEVHMQTNEFLLDLAGNILPQVFSKETIRWGIQFSYPAIFQDSYTMEVFQATRTSFLGWKLFSFIRSWIRIHTLPLPIHIQGKIIHLPVRLGKTAAMWIQEHIDRDKIPISESTISKICQE